MVIESPMTYEEKFEYMVCLLAEQTEAGKMFWTVPAEGGMFTTQLSGYTLAFIGKYVLQIRNDRGNELEEWGTPNPPPALRRLYFAARAQAFKIDTAITSILQALEELA